MKEETLRVHENSGLREEVGSRQRKPLSNVRGRVRISDPDTGEILLEKDNMITYKGRILILSKLFQGTIDSEYFGEGKPLEELPLINPEKYPQKSVLLFNVGSGGADPSEPFIANKPGELDEGIESIPFFTIDAKELTSELSRSGEAVERFSKYANLEINDEGLVSFLSKEVGESKWFYEVDTDVENEVKKIKENREEEAEGACQSLDIFKYFKLRIESEELRGKDINQIGLQFALYDESKKNLNTIEELQDRYTEIEQFSIFNFPTEAFRDTKRLLFEYFIFA